MIIANWFELYGLSLLLPIIIHTCLYIFTDTDYNDNDTKPIVVLTTLLWPLLIIAIPVLLVQGYLKLLKLSRAKFKTWQRNKAEAARRANEVVQETTEVVARTARR